MVDIVDRNERDFGDLSMRSHELIHFQLLKQRFRPGGVLVFRTGSNPGHSLLQHLWCFGLRVGAVDNVQSRKMLH